MVLILTLQMECVRKLLPSNAHIHLGEHREEMERDGPASFLALKKEKKKKKVNGGNLPAVRLKFDQIPSLPVKLTAKFEHLSRLNPDRSCCLFLFKKTPICPVTLQLAGGEKMLQTGPFFKKVEGQDCKPERNPAALQGHCW